MGLISKLFGRSNSPPPPPRTSTHIAFLAIMHKNEAALLDGLSKDPSINVNEMPTGTPMLSFAIGNGMDRAAAAILDRRPDVHLADAQFGMTALHVAVAHNKPEFVRRLLLAGADPNQLFGKPGGPQWPCLIAPLKQRNMEMLTILLEAGAKVDCDISPDAPEAEDRRATPLIAATCNGDLELMRLFIRYGANVNYWPPSTMSPLMNAAMTGQTEAAKLLVDNGALIELHSNKLNTNAYLIAQRLGHNELARFLRSRSKALQDTYPE